MKNSILVVVFFLFLSCNKKNDAPQENSNSSYSNSEENEGEESDTYSSSTSGCGLDDGSYPATVDYNNSETGYSATYTLDVDVEDCQVVQINFPNDGYLDGDHISAADLDDDGNASVYGENGKTYEIKIDN